jgi:hypothetical protein
VHHPQHAHVVRSTHLPLLLQVIVEAAEALSNVLQLGSGACGTRALREHAQGTQRWTPLLPKHPPAAL